jgi:proton glutamate symport protein
VLIRVPFITFMRAIKEPFLIAFTTASSEAALPKAMEVMERFGCPKNIVGLVLPTGYSFNLDGRRCIYRWPASLSPSCSACP